MSNNRAKQAEDRVRVVLPYEGQYLLETLSNPKWPQNLGKRRFVGGGVEDGETPQQAAARELLEELGLRINQKKFKYLGYDPNETKHRMHYLQLDKHSLKPGEYKATVGSDPFIYLNKGLPSGDDYMGADLTALTKQANRAALLKNLLSGGAAAATRAAARPAAAPLSRMSDLTKSLADRSGVSQFARQEVVRPFKLAPGQAAAGERYLQGLGAAPSVPQQAAARLLNLTDRTARLGGDAAATAGNLLGKSLPTVNQGFGQFVKTLPNLLSNPINRLPIFNKITAAMQGLKGYLPKSLRLAVPGTATGAMSAGVLAHSLANTGKQVGEIYNDSVQPLLDKVNTLTAAPDVSDKMQSVYDATGRATKAVTSALTSPIVTNLAAAIGNTPAVAAARDKAQSAASNIGTNALRGLASDLSYNVGTGMFRNTPIKLMANASPAMAAAHAAFNAYNPGLPRLSTEELKKRIAQRSLSSIRDEFTGMLPWSSK